MVATQVYVNLSLMIGMCNQNSAGTLSKLEYIKKNIHRKLVIYIGKKR